MYKISTFLLKQIIFCIPIKLSIEKYWIIQQDFLKFYMKQHKTNSLWRTQILSCSWNPFHWLHIKIIRDFTQKRTLKYFYIVYILFVLWKGLLSLQQLLTRIYFCWAILLFLWAPSLARKNKTYNKNKRKNKKVLRNLNLVSSKKNFQS